MKPTRHPTYAIDALEPRRLLSTYIVDGTSGGDVISMDFRITSGGLLFYDFSVNGVTHTEGPASQLGNQITINGMGGNDVITINRLHFNDFVRVRPSTGNDGINIAQGSLSRDIDGTIALELQPNEGNDELFIDDTAGSNFDVQIDHQRIAAGPAEVIHNNMFSSVLLATTDSATSLHEYFVDISVPNMTIDLGLGGLNIVHFGAALHGLEFSPVPMTIKGAAWVRFDDSNGAGGRTFDITPTSVFGKTLINVKAVTFYPRGDAFPNLYTFNVTGNPAESTTIESCAGLVNFGNGFNSPVDLAGFSGFFHSKVRGTTALWDSGITNPTSPFLLHTQGGSAVHQNIRKGNFNFTIRDADIDLQITEVGTTPTTFNIAKLAANSTVRLFGSDGNDTLQTVNTSANPHQFDLDNVFVGESFFFNGRGGDNLLDLNDSNGQTQFGNPQYILHPGAVGVQAGKLVKNGVTLLEYFGPNATRIKWTGSSDNDQVFFAGVPGNRVTLSGGAGNDVFSTFNPALGGGNLSLEGVDAVIDGETGFNALTVDDTAGAGVDEFVTTAAQNHGEPHEITYRVGTTSRTISYGNIQSLQIFEGSGPAITRLISKPPAAQMLVDAGGGNDTVFAGGGDIDSNGWRSTTIIGGAGSDFIRFSDNLDAPSTLETETYTLDSQSLTKGDAGFHYSGFESQEILAGNGLSGVTGPNVFHINVIPAGLPTTIIGGAQRGCTVNVGGGTVSGIGGPLTLNLGGGSLDTLTIKDQNALADNTYIVDKTSVTKPFTGQVINYSGARTMTLNAGAGNDLIDVSGVPAGMPLTVDAGLGNDAMLLGFGNVDQDILSPVLLHGANGTDTVTIDNSQDPAAAPLALNGMTYTDGQTHTFASVNSIEIRIGAGGGTIDVDANTVPTTISGGNGGDRLKVGGGNYSANILAPLTFIGGGGTDSIVYDDSSATAGGNYSFTSGNAFNKGSAASTFTNSVEHKTLEAGAGSDQITVTLGSQNLLIRGNAGNDIVTVVDMVTGTVTVDTGSETTAAGDGLIIRSGNTVTMDQSDMIGGLTVESGATLRIAQGAVIAKSAATFNMLGKIDLAGGALLFRGSAVSQATIRGLLTRGYNGGAWNGTSPLASIYSSLAATSPLADGVGYGLGSEIAPTTIGPFAIQPNDTLLRYTLDGDANLDGQVNLADFNRLASNFGQSNRVWTDGDSTYDGLVNLADFNALAGNFGQSVTAASTLGPRGAVSASLDSENQPHVDLEELR